MILAVSIDNQVEGAFVQGVGFFTNEEYATNADGLVINDGTWTYKIPTVDTIPKQFNVELINTARHHSRVLSSKGDNINASSANIFFLNLFFAGTAEGSRSILLDLGENKSIS